MGKQMNFRCPQVGKGTRQGLRNPENNDHYGYFEVQRRETTTRLLARVGAGDTQTTLLRQQVPTNGLSYGPDTSIYIAVVADGVTSTTGGAQASRIAVDAVKATLREPPSRQETLSEWLEFAVLRANDEILFEAKRNPQWEGMSTTIVLAALAGEKLYVMHLGDSRAYLMRDGALHLLTADHTWAQEALDAGSITAAEAAQHPGRNQLLRYLGSQKSISVDRGIIMPGTGMREEYLLAQPGDVVLLCTDGLHHPLPAGELRQTLLDHAGYPQDAVDELIAQAVATGERDDITAVVMELPTVADLSGDTPAAPAQPAAAPQAAARKSGRATTAFLLTALTILVVFALYWMLH
ncbi:MAG: protein phosphatase 2C domain-containing protein [Caldilineaceae bacterium]